MFKGISHYKKDTQMCSVNFTLRDTRPLARPPHPARCVAVFKGEKLKDAAGRQVDEAWSRARGRMLEKPQRARDNFRDEFSCEFTRWLFRRRPAFKGDKSRPGCIWRSSADRSSISSPSRPETTPLLLIARSIPPPPLPALSSPPPSDKSYSHFFRSSASL